MSRRSFLGSVAALGALGSTGVDGATSERQTRLRHYVVATRDMAFVCDQLYELLGLKALPKPDGPGVTEAFGFYSTMMRLGTTMLEIVQPMKPDFHLSRWLDERGGDGGYMLVLQTFDAEALKARAAAESMKPTRDQMFKGQHMVQFAEREFGAFFEFYQYTPEDDWWGGPLSRPYPDARVASDVAGCEIAVADPAAAAARAARAFLGRADGHRVWFEDRTVSFVRASARARGLVALDLKARTPDRIGDFARIGGVTFRFV